MRSERQRIRPKLKELCDFAQEWMDDVSEEESLRDWYALFKKLEYLLYDLGIEIYNLEARSYDWQIPDKDDFSNFNPKEQKAIVKYCIAFSRKKTKNDPRTS